MKKTKEKKEMEYEDAPSGFVTLYNYKEPFMPFKDQHGEGYGYQGVLLFDGGTDKVQCHLCGEWQTSLPHHIRREHNIRAAAYKEMVGLNKNSALIGEKQRELMVAAAMKNKNLKRPKIWTKAIRKRISEGLKGANREKQNNRGTCPAQLLDRLQKRADELGRCPKRREITFGDTLVKVYGSFANACSSIGFDKPTVGKKKGFTRFDAKEMLNLLKIFVETHKRNPGQSDCRRGLLGSYYGYQRHFGSLKNAIALVK